MLIYYIWFDKICKMKPYFFLQLFFILLLAGCNNADDTPKTTTTAGEITDTILPKGKYVVEETDVVINNIPDSGASINGYNEENATTRSTNKNNTTTAEDVYKRRYKNLLVYHVADTMKIKQAYTAKLILSKDQILSSIKAEMIETANETTKNIKFDSTIEIGTKMTVRLKEVNAAGSSKGFEIESLGEEGAAEQNITEKRQKAYWEWKITPLLPGQYALRFTISIIEKDGVPVSLPTKNIEVVIFAEKESFMESIGGFFKNESTKWVLTVILVPIFLAWITTKIRYRHDSRSRSAKNNPPPDNPAATPLQTVNTTTQQTLDGSE